MAKRYEMAVKTGSYQVGRDTKNRYQNCGEIHSGEHGFYARVNPYVMVGLAMQAITAGQDSMLVSLFEAKQEDRPAPASTPVAQRTDHLENYEPAIPF